LGFSRTACNGAQPSPRVSDSSEQPVPPTTVCMSPGPMSPSCPAPDGLQKFEYGIGMGCEVVFTARIRLSKKSLIKRAPQPSTNRSPATISASNAGAPSPLNPKIPFPATFCKIADGPLVANEDTIFLTLGVAKGQGTPGPTSEPRTGMQSTKKTFP